MKKDAESAMRAGIVNAKPHPTGVYPEPVEGVTHPTVRAASPVWARTGQGTTVERKGVGSSPRVV